jgi:hypothetical protein
MDTQFNFQIKPKNDRKEWEDVEVYYRILCDRKTAVHFARSFSKKFKSEIRLTEGKNPFKTSGTYIYEINN